MTTDITHDGTSNSVHRNSIPGKPVFRFSGRKKSITSSAQGTMVNQLFAGKKIVILGLARQGTALARFFVNAGANVTLSDTAPAEKVADGRAALADLPIDFVLGGHPPGLLDQCDLLCLSGGVPPQIPLVKEAIALGIPLTNDSLLTLQMVRNLQLGPVIVVTGSSGKTTTTTLVGKILAKAGHCVHVGGNIGTPLVDRLQTIYPDEPIILELSSFQLELYNEALAWGTLQGIGPDVALLLNITPNHLDRHEDMAAYAAAKLNLLHHMAPNSHVVLNVDDPVVARLAPRDLQVASAKVPHSWELEELLNKTRDLIRNRNLKVVPFSRAASLSSGAWLDGDTLTYAGNAVCQREDVLLRGEHNISNLLASFAATGASGATVEAMQDVARTFSGVAHRLEMVAQHNDVTWINDSIATSPERAIAGLRSFESTDETLILLAGGKDKNLSWDGFAAAAIDRASYVIGFGQSGPMFVNLVQERARFSQRKAPSCAVLQRLDEAVALAARIAEPGTTVLLSPGGTSYDAYHDFEERGEHFRQLVRSHMEHSAISTLNAAG